MGNSDRSSSRRVSRGRRKSRSAKKRGSGDGGLRRDGKGAASDAATASGDKNPGAFRLKVFGVSKRPMQRGMKCSRHLAR